MRIPIVIAIVVLLGAVAAGGALMLARHANKPVISLSAAPASIGGPFALIDVEGRPFTDKNLLGKPTVMFFGFTYCPEVCPTTLHALTEAMKPLGPAADGLNVVFVTIDPARDTPAQLKLYLTNFDHRIIGLTGTEAAAAQVAKAYKVYVKKVPAGDGDYTMDHSSVIYLLDRRGRFVEPVMYNAPLGQIANQLRHLLETGNAHG